MAQVMTCLADRRISVLAVANHPDDRDARLDLVRYLTWNGDFAAAEAVLLADPVTATSDEGREVHASLLAWGGRLQEAQALGAIYRETIGNWFPAMTAVEVSALIEDGALIEVEATAVIPD